MTCLVDRYATVTVVVLAVLATAGVAIVPMLVLPTESRWSHQVYVSADANVVDAREPGFAEGCVVMNASHAPHPGATCTIIRKWVNDWDVAPNGQGNVYAEMTHTAPPSQGYVAFTFHAVDGVSGWSRQWSWANAVVRRGNDFRTTSGFTCATLPWITGRGPTGWGSNQTAWFMLNENRSSVPLAQRDCV